MLQEEVIVIARRFNNTINYWLHSCIDSPHPPPLLLIMHIWYWFFSFLSTEPFPPLSYNVPFLSHVERTRWAAALPIPAKNQYWSWMDIQLARHCSLHYKPSILPNDSSRMIITNRQCNLNTCCGRNHKFTGRSEGETIRKRPTGRNILKDRCNQMQHCSTVNIESMVWPSPYLMGGFMIAWLSLTQSETRPCNNVERKTYESFPSLHRLSSIVR